MFSVIFGFELRYRFRRIATYIYFVLMALTGLLYGAIMSGGLGPEAALTLTGGGRNFANSPYNLHQIIITLAQVPGSFIIAAFMGLPVFRDFQYNTHNLFFTRPIEKSAYLGGRFLGSLVVTLFALSGTLVGLCLAFYMPWANADKVAPFELMAYLNPFITQVIPYTLLTGAVFFATVTLSRNELFIYMNAIMMLVLFSITGVLSSQIENKTLSALLDPSGGRLFQITTEFWTVAEKNDLLFPTNGLWFAHEAIWLGIGLGILVLTYRLFQFSHGGLTRLFAKRKVAEAVPITGDTLTFQQLRIPKVTRLFSFQSNLSMMFRLAGQELKPILKSPIFIAILVVGALLAVLTQVIGSGNVFGTKTLPVTYQVAGSIGSIMQLFSIVIMVFYSGELIWRERSLKIEQIQSALPLPNWVIFGSKALALMSLPFLVSLVGILMGVLVQTFSGYFRYELGVYFGLNVLGAMPNMLLFAAMALLIQVVTSNKFLGFFLTVGIYFFIPFLSELGLEHSLWSYMSGGGVTYSDMNGFGHFWPKFIYYRLYWGSLAVIMLVLANAFWPRSSESGWSAFWRRFRSQWSRSATITTVLAGISFASFGGWIWYNTTQLNTYRTEKESNKLLAAFEKKYKKYEHVAQPKITAINLRVDLMPEERNFDASGTYWLKNKTQVAIDSIHLNVAQNMEWPLMKFDRTYKRVYADSLNGYYIYTVSPALAPGDSVQFEFKMKYITRGFPEGGYDNSVVYNGTFINHGYFPSIGYSPNGEMQDEDLRKKYGLPPQPRFPSIDDTVAVNRTLFSSDADWIDFECTVTTAPDQIAIAPGYLQEEKMENGRHLYHYKMDSKMVKFYTIVSARYEVKKDHWVAPDGRDISLEIYHDAKHTQNLESMMGAMKKSLAYYSNAFGPYQHRQVRILEFPRYASFAQSFANTIPYSESIGFIADVKEDDVDYPFYITAHELAHQWWAHQVVGGYVQGFQFLSETMSQYSALMVMEKEFGKQEIKKYLKYELNNYLTQRGAEKRVEQPALFSENQAYIHYNKGSLVMYALKDYLGEDSLNAALHRYVDAVKFQEAPYTTTKEWLTYVEEVTPDSLRSVLTDLLETVTLYDNKVESATFEGDSGNYQVYLDISARKVHDNVRDEEVEVPIHDYLDIGVYGRVKEDGKWKDTLIYLQKHLIDADTMHITVNVTEKPTKAGIDPINKMIDRKPDDNVVSVKAKSDSK